MLTTIIIEDEKPAARRLDRMLNRIGIIPLVMLHSVAESVAWLQNNPNPDLIFLDVQLSDGLSFEIFDQVSVHSAIIFTTAYDEYALRAFKLNSIDYLLKPIDKDALSSAVLKYNESRSNTDVLLLKKLLFQEQIKNYKERFTIQVGQHLRMVEVKSIECFYSEDGGTYAYTDSGKEYLLSENLEQIIKELDPKTFFRVSRKFIVRIGAIQDIISYTNSRLVVKLNTFHNYEIIVSREKVKDFKNWIAE